MSHIFFIITLLSRLSPSFHPIYCYFLHSIPHYIFTTPWPFSCVALQIASTLITACSEMHVCWCYQHALKSAYYLPTASRASLSIYYNVSGSTQISLTLLPLIAHSSFIRFWPHLTTQSSLNRQLPSWLYTWAHTVPPPRIPIPFFS